MKRCYKCKLDKPFNEFYMSKTSKDGYGNLCKKCENIKSKLYYQTSKKRRDYLKSKNKNRYSVSKHLVKKWVSNNRERYNELQREARHRRNSILKKLPNNFTEKQWEECKKHFSNNQGNVECCYCGDEVKQPEKEHFIALTNGGGYVVSNILPSCKSCNSSKRNHYFYEWYPKQIFYSKHREEKILNYLKSKSKDKLKGAI